MLISAIAKLGVRREGVLAHANMGKKNRTVRHVLARPHVRRRDRRALEGMHRRKGYLRGGYETASRLGPFTRRSTDMADIVDALRCSEVLG